MMKRLLTLSILISFAIGLNLKQKIDEKTYESDSQKLSEIEKKNLITHGEHFESLFRARRYIFDLRLGNSRMDRPSCPECHVFYEHRCRHVVDCKESASESDSKWLPWNWFG